MATHSRNLAWRIPWTEEPGGARVHGVTELDMTKHKTKIWHVKTFLSDGINLEIVMQYLNQF